MNRQDPLLLAVLNGAGRPSPGICTVAFSGGADSTALLLCLYQLREALSIDLRAVHVHHGIRGEEADRDAAFCKQICEKYGITEEEFTEIAEELAKKLSWGCCCLCE